MHSGKQTGTLNSHHGFSPWGHTGSPHAGPQATPTAHLAGLTGQPVEDHGHLKGNLDHLKVQGPLEESQGLLEKGQGLLKKGQGLLEEGRSHPKDHQIYIETGHSHLPDVQWVMKGQGHAPDQIVDHLYVYVASQDQVHQNRITKKGHGHAALNILL